MPASFITFYDHSRSLPQSHMAPLVLALGYNDIVVLFGEVHANRRQLELISLNPARSFIICKGEASCLFLLGFFFFNHHR